MIMQQDSTPMSMQEAAAALGFKYGYFQKIWPAFTQRHGIKVIRATVGSHPKFPRAKIEALKAGELTEKRGR